MSILPNKYALEQAAGTPDDEVSLDALKDTLSGLGGDALNAIDAALTGAGAAVKGIVDQATPAVTK